MRNVLAAGVVILAIIAGALYYYLGIWSGEQALTRDVYPLYQQLQWSSPQKADVMGMQGTKVESDPIVNITDLASVTRPFTQYYEQKLEANDWVVDSSLAAGGPGAEQIGYTKGNDYVILGYQSVFHVRPVDAPVQCPCDITFSIWSGSKK